MDKTIRINDSHKEMKADEYRYWPVSYTHLQVLKGGLQHIGRTLPEGKVAASGLVRHLLQGSASVRGIPRSAHIDGVEPRAAGDDSVQRVLGGCSADRVVAVGEENQDRSDGWGTAAGNDLHSVCQSIE